MKKRWSDIKETAHHVLLSTGLAIWSKMAWLTIWSEKGAGRVKSIGLSVWSKLTTKLSTWRVKMTNKIRGVHLDKRHVVEASILLVLFTSLAIWLNNVLGWLTEFVSSLKVQWQVIGILGLVILWAIFVVWYLQKNNPVPPTGQTQPRISYAAKIKRLVKSGWVITVVLFVGLFVLAYFKYPWDEKLAELSDEEVKSVLQLIQKNTCTAPDPAGDIFKILITSNCPAVVKMNPNQMIVWWGDTSRFRTGWYYEKRAVPVGKITHDKFRVFQTRKGVDRVIIKIHGYYDPDPLWYTRQ